MKKLILLIGCILLLHSCEIPTQDVPQVQEKGYILHTSFGNISANIITFTTPEGHTYEVLYASGIESISHHPLCEACEAERKEREPKEPKSVLEQSTQPSNYWGW